jgi:ABC-type glycerol-3-phosphate transport system substrate-binding protein
MRLILGVMAAVLVGCGGKPPRPAPPPPRFEGVKLTIACADPVYGRVVEREAAGWALTHGATVRVLVAPKDVSEADIVVDRPGPFADAAAKGAYLPYPAEYRSAGHAGQWLNIHEIYRTRMAAWGGQILGVPLGTEALVLVYRADLYTDKSTQSRYQVAMKRALAPPATWEDLVDQAAFFTKENGKPALGHASQSDLLALFHAMAACFEREATATLPKELVELFAVSSLNFHHDLQTGKPRLHSAGFQAALQTLKNLQPSLAPAGTQTDALIQGHAVLAVVPLRTLALLQAACKFPLGIAKLPGTRTHLDWRTNRIVSAKSGVNFVPYLDATGNIGAVTKGCQQTEAAFELMAWLSGPTVTLKTIGDPSLGYGPWRAEHTAPTARGLWAGYNLDPTQTDQLMAAMQPATTINPVVAPRGPATAQTLEILGKHLSRLVTTPATVAECTTAIETEWAAADGVYNPADVLRWRKLAAGLD